MSGRRRKLRVGLAALLAVCLAVVVAACGSDSGSGGSGGEKKITGAKVIDPASMDKPAKGTIHYCTGKDTTGAAHQMIADFNKKYSSQGYKAVLTEFPASADQQRAQFIQRQQAKSNDCDVFNSDVIWTAEFASQKWLYDLTPYVEKSKDTYINAPLETVHYGGKYWGAPPPATPRSSSTARTRAAASPRRRGRRSTPTPRRPAASSTRARRTRA
jgi:multiple sugar transport system substrate-binding protein